MKELTFTKVFGRVWRCARLLSTEGGRLRADSQQSGKVVELVDYSHPPRRKESVGGDDWLHSRGVGGGRLQHSPDVGARQGARCPPRHEDGGGKMLKGPKDLCLSRQPR